MNTGAFDPLPEIVAAVRELPNAWLHVDGAFGLWAAAAPALRHRVAGLAGADSWTTDAHKWLNVPYDSGIAIVPRRRRPPRGDDARGGVLRRDGGRRARPVQLGRRSRRAARAGSRSTRRSARWAGTGSPR